MLRKAGRQELKRRASALRRKARFVDLCHVSASRTALSMDSGQGHAGTASSFACELQSSAWQRWRHPRRHGMGEGEV